MKRVIYKTLRVRNILSIGNDEITIDFTKGLNLITGKNIDNPERVNGIGKSALIEAFFIAVYGKTIRDIKKDYVINNVTKGKGNVELDLDIIDEKGSKSYTIKRQIKPSKVELWCNGVDITNDSIGNTDKFICDLIGSNPVLCRSCDILSLSDNVPFMAKKPEDKRKFINDIFSLEVFGLMMKDLKSLISTNKTEMSVSSTKIEEIQNTIDTLKKQQEEYDKKLKEREELLAAKKKDYQEKIDNLNEAISKIEIKDVEQLQKEQDKYNDAWTKIDAKIAATRQKVSSCETLKSLKEKEIKSVSSVGAGVRCDKCLQDIPHTHTDHLQKLKEEYVVELEKINSDLDEYLGLQKEFQEKKSKIQNKIGDIVDAINESKSNQQTVNSHKKSIAQYEEMISSLEEDKLVMPNIDIVSVEDRKKLETKKYEELKQYSEDLEVCKFILGDDGVKSFMVKRLLVMLNSTIQQYINDLGMTIRCVFDEFFDEKIISGGKESSYWNLSGGERRTVDLACSWAFKDIRRKLSGVHSNVEWIDEVFDSAFDERGFDLLVELVKNRIDRNDLSIYAISHRKEMVKHITVGEIIKLEKENGVTRRVFD
jgi:DNA repair exonuclease SbcCD ATPase subunit